MNSEKKYFIQSIYLPALLVIIIWVIKIFEIIFDVDFGYLGVYPREVKGLPGIILSPFIHGNFNHLISNSIPLFVLGTGIFYFYRRIAYRVIIQLYLITNICVWIGARPSYHIGASGIIYAFAAFLFFSGIFRKDRQLLVISLLTVFLYGGMVWGLFPTEEGISFESHLFGFVTGTVMALYYKNEKDTHNEDQDEIDDSPFSSTHDIDFIYEITEE